jgi:soluble lytic murein transglycosylase-like protein
MLGLRLNDEERRHADRRASARGTRDRRRGERRRARLRNLLFTGLALAVPHQTSHAIVWKLPPPPLWLTGPRVSTSIDSVVPIEPARAYDSIIADAAKTYRVDATLIRSVMNAESGFDPSAVSRAGAMGLMQIMPEIAETFGVEHPFDPRENIMAGARLLRELLDQHQGIIPLVLASYNAGPSAVADWGGVVPPFAETQGYVKRVTGLIADARRGDTEN